MKRSLLVLFIVMTACASHQAAQPAPTEPALAQAIIPSDSPDQGTIFLHCRMHDELCYVSASVNDSRELKLIVDTGSSLSVLNSRVAKEIGLKSAGAGQAAGPGDGETQSLSYTRFDNVKLVIDDFVSSGQTFIGLPFDYVSKRMRTRTDGTVGASVLKKFMVEMNYEKGEVVFYQPGTWPLDPGYESLPLEFEGDCPVVRASVGGVEGRFLIDTGQMKSGLFITQAFAAAHPGEFAGVSKSKQKPVEAVGGTMKFSLGTVPSLSIGKIAVQNVRTSFLESANGVYSNSAIAGGIGPKAFAHFDLIIDYPNKRLYFKRW